MVEMDGVRSVEELQERLEGVYDLNRAEDCWKVIGVLLRSVRQEKATAQQAVDRLKTLALMVVNENPAVRDKAREAIAGSGKSKKELFDFLMDMAKTMDSASELSNKQLVGEVTDTIWAELDMSSRESAVLGELIYRMKKLTGMLGSISGQPPGNGCAGDEHDRREQGSTAV